jgi:hypothetical protein
LLILKLESPEHDTEILTTTPWCLVSSWKYGCEYVDGQACHFIETQRTTRNDFAAESSGRKTAHS